MSPLDRGIKDMDGNITQLFHGDRLLFYTHKTVCRLRTYDKIQLMAKTLLLFDIDGTLLLTGGAGKIAFEEAFEEIFEIPNAWGDLDPHGKTDPAIFDEVAKRELGRLLSPGEFDLLMERYEEIFEERIQQSPRFELMPGVVAILEHLSRDTSLFLSLATGNFERAGRMKLQRGGVEHYFLTGGFGNDAREREKILLAAVAYSEEFARQRFEKDRIFVIGDTEYDIAAAKKAGLRSIAVLTNGRTHQSFEKDPPNHILQDLTDISAFMACLK
jgi:phosphoglycolate phosphatase-like HAD superfamily hydrolase